MSSFASRQELSTRKYAEALISSADGSWSTASLRELAERARLSKSHVARIERFLINQELISARTPGRSIEARSVERLRTALREPGRLSGVINPGKTVLPLSRRDLPAIGQIRTRLPSAWLQMINKDRRPLTWHRLYRLVERDRAGKFADHHWERAKTALGGESERAIAWLIAKRTYDQAKCENAAAYMMGIIRNKLADQRSRFEDRKHSLRRGFLRLRRHNLRTMAALYSAAGSGRTDARKNVPFLPTSPPPVGLYLTRRSGGPFDRHQTSLQIGSIEEEMSSRLRSHVTDHLLAPRAGLQGDMSTREQKEPQGSQSSQNIEKDALEMIQSIPDPQLRAALWRLCNTIEDKETQQGEIVEEACREPSHQAGLRANDQPRATDNQSGKEIKTSSASLRRDASPSRHRHQ